MAVLERIEPTQTVRVLDLEMNDFYPGATQKFRGRIRHNGTYPDIRSDEVRLIIKNRTADTDAEAVLNEVANVADEGETGWFNFNLTAEMTTMQPRQYVYEYIWTADGEEHVLAIGSVRALRRAKEVPPPA